MELTDLAKLKAQKTYDTARIYLMRIRWASGPDTASIPSCVYD